MGNTETTRWDTPTHVMSSAELNAMPDLGKRRDAMEENRFWVFMRNVKYLLEEKSLSQRSFCSDTLDGLLTAPMLTTYKKKGRNIPLRDMCLISAAFGYTVEQMCGQLLEERVVASAVVGSVPSRHNAEYCKYIGHYELNFFDTSSPLGENGQTPDQSLASAILTIYTGAASLGREHLRVAAFFNCTAEERKHLVTILKDAADDENFNPLICFERVAIQCGAGVAEREKCFYEGFLELTERMSEITLHQVKGNDIVHLTFHNAAAISAAGKPYKGGLATMMSISRGAEHMPVIQAVIIARAGCKNNVSNAQLSELLYLRPPRVEIGRNTDEIIDYMRLLYAIDGATTPLVEMNEEDKHLFLKTLAEKKLTDVIRRNVVSYYKISTEMDKLVYEKLFK